MVRGCTEVPGGECHRHETGFGKREDEVRNLCHFQFIWHGCQQMCRQTMVFLLCMCSGFPTKLMEQMIVTSLGDVMGVLLCDRGREV